MRRIALIGLSLLAGCTHTVTFHTVPEGADVTVDGTPIGQTPVAWRQGSFLGRTEPYVIGISKPGFRPVQAAIQDHWDEGNFALGSLLGLLGCCLCGGATYAATYKGVPNQALAISAAGGTVGGLAVGLPGATPYRHVEDSYTWNLEAQ